MNEEQIRPEDEKQEEITVEEQVVEEKPEEIAVEETVVEEKPEEIAVEEAVVEEKPEEIAVEEAVVEEKPEEIAVEEAVVEEKPEEIAVEETVVVEEKPEETFEAEVTKVKKAEHNTVKENKASKQSDDEFWSDLEEEDRRKNVKSEARKKLEELYSASMNSIKEKEILEGAIVSIDAKEVLININYKSDGVIPYSEVKYLDGSFVGEKLKIGDKIEVMVVSLEDEKGRLSLSHKQARTLKAWEKAIAMCENKEQFVGTIKSRTKGGMIVDVMGLDAFLPGSQINMAATSTFDEYVGKNIELLIIKINNETKNIVVSHKAISEEEDEANKQQFRESLEKGGVYKGIVKNITPYGVFVDLGNGVDGLVVLKDLSWKRVSDPHEIVEVGQEIEVVVLDFDEARKKIALGIKQLTPAPWEAMGETMKEGTIVTGKVVKSEDYGVFVEIQPGIEGLIHVSEMTWSQHVRSPKDFVEIGQDIKAVIISLDKEQQRMSLSIKRLTEDPWLNIEKNYAVGTKHIGIVKNFTVFGIFVELEPGIDGLIHISDLSWTKKIRHPEEFTKVGAQIETVVLEIITDMHQIKLGHKQVEENPWDVYASIFTKGSIHEAKIISMTEKNATIVFDKGLESNVSLRNMKKEDGTTPKEGDTLPFIVMDFNEEGQRLIVSHVHTYKMTEEEERRVSENVENEKNSTIKEINKKSTKSTLADLEDLQALKQQFEKSEKKAKKSDKDKE